MQNDHRKKGERHVQANSSKLRNKSWRGDRRDGFMEFKSVGVVGNIARFIFMGICDLLCDLSPVIESRINPPNEQRCYN
jgi:hypothetical protein